MTKQTLKSKLRAGYTAMLFAFSVMCPAFFFVAAHEVQRLNPGGAMLCSVVALACAFLAGYSDNKLKSLK